MLTIADASIRQWKEIQNIQSPTAMNLMHIKDWMLRAKSPLEGTDSRPWRRSSDSELMVLSPDADKLDNWLCKYLAPAWHRVAGERLHRRRAQRLRQGSGDTEEAQDIVFGYEEAAFVLIGDIVCVVLSTVLLISAVIGLYYINTMLNRLIFVAVFTLLFAGVLMFVANCRRVDVFGATAAFCAVLVVFIQNIAPAGGR